MWSPRRAISSSTRGSAAAVAPPGVRHAVVVGVVEQQHVAGAEPPGHAVRHRVGAGRRGPVATPARPQERLEPHTADRREAPGAEDAVRRAGRARARCPWPRRSWPRRAVEVGGERPRATVAAGCGGGSRAARSRARRRRSRRPAPVRAPPARPPGRTWRAPRPARARRARRACPRGAGRRRRSPPPRARFRPARRRPTARQTDGMTGASAGRLQAVAAAAAAALRVVTRTRGSWQ